MEYSPSSPTEYKLESVLISHGRNEHEFDITAAVIEIELYEHMERTYITGALTFLDDARVVEAIDFNGTEKVTIVVAMHQTDFKIKKEFAIRQVTGITPATDTSDAVALALIDIDAYISSLINVNKVYEGRPSEIIAHVLQDNFGANKTLNRGGTTAESNNPNADGFFSQAKELQNSMRYIVPNKSPYQVIDTMTRRATGTNGMPCYCYASLSDNNLRFFDLYSLITQSSINAENPLLRSAAAVSTSEATGDALALNIEEMEIRSSENALRLIMNGDIGAQYEYVDTTAAIEQAFAYDIGKVFKQVLPANAAPVFDTQTKFNNKSANEYRSQRITQIATTSIYEAGVGNIYEEGTTARQSAKAISKSFRNLAKKSPVQILVAGRQFFPQGDHRTVGNMISILTMANEQATKGEPNIDQKRSGDYLVYGCNHIMGKESYKIKMSLIKITNYKGNTGVS
jgi:hypothetical protein